MSLLPERPEFDSRGPPFQSGNVHSSEVLMSKHQLERSGKRLSYFIELDLSLGV